MPSWVKHKLESRLPREMASTLDTDDTALMEESEEELKSLLMKVKEESGKIKTQHSKNENHGIWFHHFMANRWGNSVNSGRLF